MTMLDEPAPAGSRPNWGLLLGLTPPPAGRSPQAPHDVFGRTARTGSEADRAAIPALRREHLVAHLREHGPHSTRALANAFGVSVQAITADLKVLTEQGLVHGTRAKRPIWRAGKAPVAAPEPEPEGAAMQYPETHTNFKHGQTVRKSRGSQWHGTVVGWYATTLTPEGYAVESATEKGSVQIYPAAALEPWSPSA